MERLSELTKSISSRPRGFDFTQGLMVRMLARGSIVETRRLLEELPRSAAHVGVMLKEAWQRAAHRTSERDLHLPLVKLTWLPAARAMVWRL